MKKTTAQRARLGVFVIFSTTILIVALYLIGNRQHLFTKNIELKAQFANVNGLQEGNNVRYSGITIGTVSKIEILSDTLITIRMMIKEQQATFIKKNAIAAIGSDGLVGNMIVNILPRSGNYPKIETGDRIETYSKIGADDMLTTLNVTNENAALLTADLLKITTAIIEGEGVLGMLIYDSLAAQNVKHSLFELRKASTMATTVVTALHDKITQIDMNESPAGVLLTNADQGEKIKNLIGNIDDSGIAITQLSEKLDSLVTTIQKGKGVLNYLSTDEQFVRDIDSTMQHIKESSARFNENMEALKNNFLFRGYFKKQERKAKREAHKVEETNN